MSLYERIGERYDTKRRPDPSVTRAMFRALALEPGETLVDVGSGTGGYARALADEGLRVFAVEPSRIMRAQAIPHRAVEYRAGRAHAIPLPDGAARAATCVLSMNHFGDLEASMREIDRVTARGPIVVVTVDSREAEPYWIDDYFPFIVRANQARVPPIEETRARLAQLHERPADVSALPVPRTFRDLFFGAGWSRPELMLDPTYRGLCSSFARADATEVAHALERLARDLEGGAFWDRHAALSTRTSFDVGLRLLRVSGGPSDV